MGIAIPTIMASTSPSVSSQKKLTAALIPNLDDRKTKRKAYPAPFNNLLTMAANSRGGEAAGPPSRGAARLQKIHHMGATSQIGYLRFSHCFKVVRFSLHKVL
jgi:hypothetical protein